MEWMRTLKLLWKHDVVSTDGWGPLSTSPLQINLGYPCTEHREQQISIHNPKWTKNKFKGGGGWRWCRGGGPGWLSRHSMRLTLDLGVVSTSPTLGTEPTWKRLGWVGGWNIPRKIGKKLLKTPLYRNSRGSLGLWKRGETMHWRLGLLNLPFWSTTPQFNTFH